MTREIIFEPAVHEFIRDRMLQVGAKYGRGDLSATIWNLEVASRMRKYSPEVVGIDSLVPSFYYDSADLMELEFRSVVAWPILPGSPMQMSGRESVFVVAGDPLEVMDWTPEDKTIQIPEQLSFLKQVPLTVEPEPQAYIRQAIAEGLTPLVLGAGLLGAGQRFSRRNFLRLAGLGTIALTLGKSAPLIHSYETNNNLRGVMELVTKLTKPVYAKSNWLDARTALVIAKTAESMDVLGLAQEAVGSVVMGYPHAYEAGVLNNDVRARQSVIRAYAQELLDLVHKMIETDTDRVPDADILGSLFPYLAAADIYKVSTPDLENTNPISASSEAIQFVTKFFSEEVIEALKPMDSVGVFDGDFEAKYKERAAIYEEVKKEDELLKEELNSGEFSMEDGEELDSNKEFDRYWEKRREMRRRYYSGT